MKTLFPSRGKLCANGTWSTPRTGSRARRESGRTLADGQEQAHLYPFPGHWRPRDRHRCAKVRLTGRKEDQKLYRRHSGYPGGLTETKARKVRATHPGRLVEDAIHGMLPKTKLGKQMYRKLKVYAGDKHPHEAQKPVALEVEAR